jgi:hypothetical protein
MAGHELARNNLGNIEAEGGNIEQAIKHWTIAASAGDYCVMHHLTTSLEIGVLSI